MPRPAKYNPKEILIANGPLLSGELADIMSKKHGVKRTAAKKAIERFYSKKEIMRLDFMTFGRGEYLYFTEGTNQPAVTTKALKEIKNRRPIVYRLWKALMKAEILPHRDGLKITGLPTKQVGKRESYEDVMNYLIKLGLAYNERIILGQNNLGFFILRKNPSISNQDIKEYAERIIIQNQTIRRYLDRAKQVKMVKNIKVHTQVGHRIFDAVGEAVSRRYMVVVFDFNLMRTTEEFDIEGLLDRIFSVYRKKFKNVVIAYCVSKKFTKEAQHKAMTGRFKQINLIQVGIQNSQLVTKKIDGISKQSRGEFFENQIRYILKKSGFKDVQRGLKVYTTSNGLSEKITPEEFTDIDIIARSKEKLIICELKNWYHEVPQNIIEEWVKNKLNPVVDFLRKNLNIQDDIEVWFIVSYKPKGLNEVQIQMSCKCLIKVLSKTELINDVISKMDIGLASELKPIILFRI